MMQTQALVFPIRPDLKTTLRSLYVVNAQGQRGVDLELDQQLLVGRDYCKAKNALFVTGKMPLEKSARTISVDSFTRRDLINFGDKRTRALRVSLCDFLAIASNFYA